MNKFIKKSVAIGLATMLTLSGTSMSALANSNLVNSDGSVNNDISNITPGNSSSNYSSLPQGVTGYDDSQDRASEYKSIDGTTDQDSNVNVYTTQEESAEIIIPKTIILDGTNTTAAGYKVKVRGNISGTTFINIVPESNSTEVNSEGEAFPDPATDDAYFYMGTKGKQDVIAAVNQVKDRFEWDDLKDLEDDEYSETSGTVESTITAGMWHGNFNFNVNLEDYMSNAKIEYFTWGEDAAFKTSYANNTINADYSGLTIAEENESSSYDYPDATQITGLTDEGLEWLENNGGRLILPNCATSTAGSEGNDWDSMLKTGVFSGCNSNYGYRIRNILNFVDIPESVKQIGRYSFADEPNIKTVYIDGAREIGNGAFLINCGLTSVILNNTVKTIGSNAFLNCKNLVELTGCSSIESLGANAFTYDYNFTGFDNLGSCKTIGISCFTYDSSLKNLNLDKNTLTSVGEKAFCHTGISMDYFNTFGNTTFGTNAFWPNTNRVNTSYTYTPIKMDITGFSQRDTRWAETSIAGLSNRQFGTNGCTWMALTAAYNHLKKDNKTPVEIVNIINQNTNYFKSSPGNDGTLAPVTLNSDAVYIPPNNEKVNVALNSIGLTYRLYRLTNTNNLQNILNELMDGNPVVLSHAGLPSGSRHATLLYGINEDGEVLVADSSTWDYVISNNNGTLSIENSPWTKPRYYTMPLENYICSVSDNQTYAMVLLNNE